MSKKICQSCGMEMTAEVFGTNTNGSANEDYCIYCFKSGQFTEPNATMNEMIEANIPDMGMPTEEARAKLNELYPTLKRWQA